MVKKKSLLRLSIIIIAIIVSIILYNNSYKVTEKNMESSLLEEVQTKTLNIIDLYPVAKSPKHQIAFFELKEGTGIALLHKGFNNKYLTVDIHKTDEVVDRRLSS